MSEAVDRLWVTLVGLAAGDAITTLVALSLGLPEANPVIVAAIDAVGLLGVPLSQLVYITAAWLVVRQVDRNQHWVLAAGIVPSALVVANNTVWIALVVSGVIP
ncbi:hypothetical protein D8Y22_12725 [Salinadaptatus halalkaliphilus]|uniref:DUF5658 domain-containing protein n=1 Tax=Salinadaptatus halalkaliphilus TaxID=2419781 RepID=A0A4S3TK93_9EURY|nr:hypothetical protein [Salinadaptatus halalkaliphilus]THE64501.1 hypothetical protein D8Y22_12725 [Salinadaptatus halalkaliphilus]